MVTPLDAPCLVAELKLLPVSESGNASPVFSGWRPLLQYDSGPKDLLFGGNTVVLTKGRLDPDETGRAVVRLFPKVLRNHSQFATPNATFRLLDGPNVRATGVVVELMGLQDDHFGDNPNVVG